MIVYLTRQQISDLKDILIYQRQLPQLTQQCREKMYLLYDALDKAKPAEPKQYKYMHIIVGSDMIREINHHVENGWEVVSHAVCCNNNKSVLFRKELNND